MNLPIKKTIREETSQVFLERTRKRHHGFGYRELLEIMRAKTSVSAAARMYGVTNKTMKSWQAIVHEELDHQMKDTINAHNEYRNA